MRGTLMAGRKSEINIRRTLKFTDLLLALKGELPSFYHAECNAEETRSNKMA